MDNTVRYVCKYTPVELLVGLGLEPERLDPSPASFDCAEECAHPNLCGFGKAVLEEVLTENIRSLFLVDCCDVCRRLYDILLEKGNMDFLFLMELPHKNGKAENARLEKELLRLREALSGRVFDEKSALASRRENGESNADKKQPYIRLAGAHGGKLLRELASERLPLPVSDETCTGRRELSAPPDKWSDAEYAAALLGQKSPCMRMQFYQEENESAALGTIFNTVKFCDFYGFQYRAFREKGAGPLLKIETDCSRQSGGQLKTRLDAFAEMLGLEKMTKEAPKKFKYVAGVDSGSASTDAVILDENLNIVGSAVLPTGSGASAMAEAALSEALSAAGISREDLSAVVTTGYGRSTIGLSETRVTEITCHAKGANFLCPGAKTVIDIGGQDSKVICTDGKGAVRGFVMNDKCAAGTGRFLEMMSRALGMNIDEMSRKGLDWKNEVTISSMCTVFAESEVVSLVAKNTPPEDIIHGLNAAVAARTVSLAKRAGGAPPYIMTGGVAKNAGIVKALEEKLSAPVTVPEEAQICGALGAALIAAETL